MSLNNSRELQTLNNFMKFLETRFTALESTFGAKAAYLRKPATWIKPNTAGTTLMTTDTRTTCKICNQGHHIQDCMKFKSMNIYEKNQLVSLLGLCRNCLKSNHSSTGCRINQSCKLCRGRHHHLLHTSKDNDMEQSKTKTGVPSNDNTSLHTTTKENNNEYVLLPTALVRVPTNDGRCHYLRAIIDPCSQASFITADAASGLKLKTSITNITIAGIGTNKKQIQRSASLLIMPRFHSEFQLQIQTLVVNKITHNQPQRQLTSTRFNDASKLPLADPDYNIPAPIQLLLGADYYADIILPEILKQNNQQPIAQRSELGWIILGKTSESFKPNNDPLVKTVAITSMESTLNEIEKTLKKFWEIEELHPPLKQTVEEEECEQHFQTTFKRATDGRYIVKLPFLQTSKDIRLGDSKKMAIARFLQLEKQLLRNNELATDYKKFMEEYEQLGHMQKVSSVASTDAMYFMPHHGVHKPTSTTSKLRVVFDASAKTTSGHSLNNIMSIGPKLQQDLWHIVMRWRKHKYAITADIEKMFRQIWVDDEDRNFQRILWRNSPTEKLQEYQLKTVTYGTSAATYLAVRALQQLAEDEKEAFPSTYKIVKNDFYVDDLMTGCDSAIEARVIQNQLKELLSRGGFNLRKWASNHEDLQNNIPEDESTDSYKIEIDQSIKALGLLWTPKTDVFQFKVDHLTHSGPVTKRNVLSTTAKMFDPIGWLAPVIVTPKIMLQKLWLLGLNWDEPVPDELAQEWLAYTSRLLLLNELKIPRWISSTSTSEIEVHGFSDASEQAYAACVYLKVKNKDEVKVSLIAAKTRVAPTKIKMTLPRLELNATLLLAKLLREVKQAMEIQQAPTVAWTDSTIVLSWIKGDIQKYKTFVANRVSEIRNLTELHQWRHVKSSENPADCASRGIKPQELISHSLWWTGPHWLKKSKDNYPSDKLQHAEPETAEMKTNLTTIKEEEDDRILLLINKISNFTKLKRTIRILINFVKRCRKMETDKYDLNEPEKIILRHTQASCFHAEITQLKKGNPINNKSKILQLSPFLDKDGILRVGGRLQQSLLNYEEKHPAIIPSHHQLSKTIISHAHNKTMHGGPQLTLAFIRKKYWIINSKTTTNAVISKCVTCHRFKTNPSGNQLMGNLPSPRVQPSRPFSHTGVDYAGPLQIKTRNGRGSKTYKAYMAIFICLTTKAMHIEVVTDLTTEAFIAALKRFTSRRGVCSDIYSDNATNFIGANNKLKAAFNNVVADQMAGEGITWHFQPPASPHFGGLWEAGVKSVKTHLKKVVGNSKLTYEELTTVLNQIEAVLNSRPLCPLSNDITDLETLTPGHFLIGSSMTTIPERNLENTNIHRLTRWQMLEKLKHDFWKKWSNEYLHRLQQRPKWLQSKRQIEVGDLVLLIEENLPPLKWVRGRVVDTHPGADGKVRVVTIHGPGNSLYKRAITKVSALPKEEPLTTTDGDNLTIDSLDVVQTNTRRPLTRGNNNSKLLLHTVTIMCMLGVVLAGATDNLAEATAKYNISKFTSHPGIYLDKIGQGRLINGEWRIITYYNLTSYWQELDHLRNCTRQLDQLCANETLTTLLTYSNKTPTTHLTYSNTYCAVISSQIKILHAELNDQNIILNTLGGASTTRNKRSPFDFVGTIANELFGVLDQRAGHAYKESIEQLNANQQHQQKLLQQQISILESTVNVMKYNYKETSEKFKEYNTILSKILFHEEFTDLALHTMLEMMKLRSFQSSIIETITEVHHGQLDPLILTPHQLQGQIRQIIQNLKPSQDIPYRNNMAAIYKTIVVKTIKIEETILFEIRIPLVQRTRYDIYHFIPVPTIHQLDYVYIKPSSTYLMIAIQQNQYMTLSTDELNTCTHLNNEYICDIHKPLFDYSANTSNCELQLIKQPDQLPTSCEISKMDTTTLWIPLRRYNAWIFVMKSKTLYNLVCENDSNGVIETTQTFIEGEGILTMNPSCVLKGDTVTIAGRSFLSSNLELSFTPQFNLSNIVQRDITGIKTTSGLTISEIRSVEASIEAHKKELARSTTNVSLHDYHHYLAIYLLLPAALITVTWYVIKRTKIRAPAADHPVQLPDV